MRFQNYALLSKTPSIDFRPQHCFDAFSTVHTEKILKTIKLHLNSIRMLQTHAPAIFSVIVFIFDASVSISVHTNPICMHFRFDPLSIAFSDRCVFDENAQRISVTEDLNV